MRLSITLNPLRPLRLPVHYNSQLQGFIYKHIEPLLCQHLHNVGYEVTPNGRRFKLFTYSKLSLRHNTF